VAAFTIQPETSQIGTLWALNQVQHRSGTMAEGEHMTKLLLSLGVLTMLVACGSSGSDPAADPNADPSQDPDSGAPSSGGMTGNLGGGGGAGDAGGGVDPNCAGTVAETQKSKVDIVFVIDDSGSMTEEMNQIKTNVNTFAQKIGGTGLDYQVLFIVKKAKSSTQQGNVICVPPPLGGANCGDNAPIFHHIDQDVQSNDALSLVLSTYDNNNAALAWNKYLRADSTKVFVVVTDDESQLAYDKFDAQLLAKAPAGMFGTTTARKYIFHSICGWNTGQPVPSNQKCSTAVAPGTNYQELSKLTSGIVDSVCKTDYSGVLDNMAKGITDKLACNLGVPMAATSDPSKVAVQETKVGGAAKTLTHVTDASKCSSVKDGWYYDSATAPKEIILCPDACTDANATAGTKIQAVVGCAVPPPK